VAAIVVVGAGVAGLTCAWRLGQAGHDVEVLERESASGGRMRSERHGDFRLERGAQLIASGYRNLHDVATLVGLGPRIVDLAPASNAVLRAGRLEPADYDSPLRFLRSRLLSARAKARLPRVLLELWRHRRVLDPWRPERAAELDQEDLARWLRRVAGEEAAEYLLAPAFASSFDSDPENLSCAFGLLALRFVVGGFRLQTLEGGLGTLTSALAERVPVRLGCEVLSVETETGGARVRYRSPRGERSVFADAVVMAVPGTAVAALCPKLTPAERAFFECVHYARGIVAYLLLDREPAVLTHYGVGFPRSEGLDLYGLAVEHHKPGVCPPGAGLLNVALTSTAAEQLWGAPDALVAEVVLENLARTPIGRLSPRAVVVHRWDPMLPQPRVGSLRRLAAFLGRSDRSPRLVFAGDYLVGPYAEMALTSGARAATEVCARLAEE
jgi:oxygen-dependent protoporphyrinogen oxidase